MKLFQDLDVIEPAIQRNPGYRKPKALQVKALGIHFFLSFDIFLVLN